MHQFFCVLLFRFTPWPLASLTKVRTATVVRMKPWSFGSCLKINGSAHVFLTSMRPRTSVMKTNAATSKGWIYIGYRSTSRLAILTVFMTYRCFSLHSSTSLPSRSGISCTSRKSRPQPCQMFFLQSVPRKPLQLREFRPQSCRIFNRFHKGFLA